MSAYTYLIPYFAVSLAFVGSQVSIPLALSHFKNEFIKNSYSSQIRLNSMEM